MSGIYTSGVKKEKQEQLPSRVSLVKFFALKFRKEISQRMDEFESINQDSPIGSELASELKVFVTEVLNCINKVLSLKSGISTDCKNHIDKLQLSLIKFKSVTQKLTGGTFAIYKDDTNPWAILTSDCQHFINQFWMTCDLYWASKELPFRPTDRELKFNFLKAVIHYSETVNPKRFPPYLWILKELKTPKKTISARTYGLWKKQLENETFHKFTQPRKKIRQ
jgi:hypothetical protein